MSSRTSFSVSDRIGSSIVHQINELYRLLSQGNRRHHQYILTTGAYEDDCPRERYCSAILRTPQRPQYVYRFKRPCSSHTDFPIDACQSFDAYLAAQLTTGELEALAIHFQGIPLATPKFWKTLSERFSWETYAIDPRFWDCIKVFSVQYFWKCQC